RTVQTVDIGAQEYGSTPAMGGPSPDPGPQPEAQPHLGPAVDPAPVVDPVSVENGDVLLRWNAGTKSVAALDDGPDWTADTSVIIGAGGVATYAFAASGSLDASAPEATPTGIFDQEHFWWQTPGDTMGLEFGNGALEDGLYAVRLYMGDSYVGTDNAGERIFDVMIEDKIFIESLDLSATLGSDVGGMYEWQGEVTDGTINIDFIPGIQNPLINAVEIIFLDSDMLL
ncbi:MAG: malectin domain-containing carbohydrate-binding protein, partial [Paracoccaceae bacterium]